MAAKADSKRATVVSPVYDPELFANLAYSEARSELISQAETEERLFLKRLLPEEESEAAWQLLRAVRERLFGGSPEEGEQVANSARWRRAMGDRLEEWRTARRRFEACREEIASRQSGEFAELVRGLADWEELEAFVTGAGDPELERLLKSYDSLR
jgi:hypothetical protein